MGRRYLVLRAFSLLLRIVGWLLVIAGLVVFVIGVVTLARAAADATTAHDMLAGGFGTIIAGLIFVLYGEIIEVFFDIEANTRRSTELLERITATQPPAPHSG
jgi:hypothetical protein